MKKLMKTTFFTLCLILFALVDLNGQDYKKVTLNFNDKHTLYTYMHPTPLSRCNIEYEESTIFIFEEEEYGIMIEWMNLSDTNSPLAVDNEAFISNTYDPVTYDYEVGEFVGYKNYGTDEDGHENYLYLIENKQYRFYISCYFITSAGEDNIKDIVNGLEMH